MKDMMQRDEKQLELAKLRAQQETAASERRELEAKAELQSLRDRYKPKPVGKTTSDILSQLQEGPTWQARWQEEQSQTEVLLQDLKQTLGGLQSGEEQLKQAKVRAQQEAAAYERHKLELEDELELLRSRLERPS
ncbi:hypothetical protein FRC01_003654 [Tulasnella sp. 417]|nr:hypothetical protein FRC01_003654 [Tulasnella sp. 417]